MPWTNKFDQRRINQTIPCATHFLWYSRSRHAHTGVAVQAVAVCVDGYDVVAGAVYTGYYPKIPFRMDLNLSRKRKKIEFGWVWKKFSEVVRVAKEIGKTWQNSTVKFEFPSEKHCVKSKNWD
ncbi:hypothetical protein RUM43_002417 [Polyplax serrata]|uniref:Uncharacterized protein n=1 Tax=Polyplax serrata TaxID=468196 RepID=A0AAN8PMB9_POLSC